MANWKYHLVLIEPDEPRNPIELGSMPILDKVSYDEY